MKPAHSFLIALSALALAVSFFAIGWVIARKATAIQRGALANRVICTKVDKLDEALIQIVKSSGRKPPRPGDYGYDYYVHHPREARSLRGGRVNAGTLRILRRAACDPKNIMP